jgi:hypothetical protein
MNTIPHLATALALAFLGDQLLFDVGPVGLNAAVLLAATVLALLATRRRVRLDGRTRALAAALLGLAGALALGHVGVGLLLALAGVTTLGIWIRCGSDADVSTWVGRMLAVALDGWRKPLTDLPKACRNAPPLPLERAGATLRDWALPVGLTGVFVALFAMANPLVDRALSALQASLDRMLGAWLSALAVDRVIGIVALLAFAWMLLRFRTRGRLARVRDDELSFRDDVVRPATVVRCLALFNAVFLVQTLLDAAVLVGGGGLPAGMSYAEYAHRGAYPLIATALLAGLFVTITFSSGQKAAEERTARRLVYAWIAQNLLLLASTVYRLGMYVEVYGLSRWRLATMVWMGLVALGFWLIACRIRSGRTNGWLVRTNALALVAVLYASTFFDASGFIARYNLHHCAERGGRGPALDRDYMVSLGIAALPALEQFARDLGSKRDDLLPRIERLRAHRASVLADWRTWTVRASIDEARRPR